MAQNNTQSHAYKHLGNFVVKEPFAVGDGKARLEYRKGDRLAKLQENDSQEIVWFDPVKVAFISDHPIFEENCLIEKRKNEKLSTRRRLRSI